MDAFVRQLAVLSVLWSLSELLLPEGRQQKMARMTVSVLVMTALLSGMGKLVQSRLPTITALASQGFLTGYCKRLQSYGIPVFDLPISVYITFKLSFHAGHFLIFQSKQSVFFPQFPMILAKQCI